jgi:hypothetical protein
MLKHSKLGQDAIEVIASHGKDTRSYASFVAFVENGNARSPRLKFRPDGESTALTELQVPGKSFRLAPSWFANESGVIAGL